MEFHGFPVAALDFYDDLEMDNTKSFWEKHKHVYDEAVKAPMQALMAALTPEFAPDGQTAKIFRPYRDVRFAKDKTPYKTHQGAYVAVAPSTGWYVQVSAAGVRTGAGFYEASGAAAGVVPGRHRLGPHRARAGEDPGEAPAVGRHDRRGQAQDHAARLRRRPPAHRPAAAQVDDRGARARVRHRDLDPGAARRRPQGLARLPALRRVGRRPLRGLTG